MPFHPGFRGKGLVPVTWDHTAMLLSATANTNQFTFNGTAIGTADADRYILIAPRRSQILELPTSVTVNGNAATSISSNKWFLAAVPSGTTANIVLNYGFTVSSFAYIWVTALYGINATPYDLADTGPIAVTTNPRSVNIDAAAGGVVIAYDYATHDATASSFSWSGITERFETNVNGSPTARTLGGGSDQFMTPQTVAVSVTRSGGDASGSGILYGISFAPP